MATEKKRLLTETPSAGVWKSEEDFQKSQKKAVITDALQFTKSVRDKAIENAHNALVDAFGPKIAEMASEKLAESSGAKVAGQVVTKLTTEEGNVTEFDIDQLIKELENAPEDDDMVQECRKRLDEAKNPSVPSSEKERMYRDIHRKFWAYAHSLPNKDFTTPKKFTETDQAVRNFMANRGGPIKWISHEASMLICTLIAVSDEGVAYINLNQIPELDRALVTNMTGGKVVTGFIAELDKYKNFECSSAEKDVCPAIHFTLGNRVASIPPNETKIGSDVKVEKKGREIVIGDTIKLEKNRIQNLVNQTESTNNGYSAKGSFVPRPKVSGRNAYEIRADVLEMALDWAKSSGDKKLETDDVLDIAEAFYSFVEHK